jgi:hypothetical protein
MPRFSFERTIGALLLMLTVILSLNGTLARDTRCNSIFP